MPVLIWPYAGFITGSKVGLLLGLCGPTPDLLWVYCGFIDGSMLSLLWVSMLGLLWVNVWE